MTLAKYNAANLDQLMDRIAKNSIGMDEYFERVFNTSVHNYPPYNVIQVNSTETRLEIALAGFKKEQVHAYTEYGKLFVRGEKESPDEEGSFIHKGLAQRNFERSWTLADDTEVSNVVFEDGLLSITLTKVIPEHHQRKDYL
ncbi:heat shock protein [Synechococcus phage S-B43]|jgi:molecular chaperone IbpA|nr:heat shock protein [Synechococcus phage S-B05]QDH50573.1 heat shock protein [Synechococcus phage S-B43]